MSSDSRLHCRAAVELNARPPMVTCSVPGTSSMVVASITQILHCGNADDKQQSSSD